MLSLAWSVSPPPTHPMRGAHPRRRAAQDVSRLLDLCRQSIYFESLAGAAACLAAIARDGDVAVARVKNRLDPDLDAAATAGYRNLAVNLRLVTPEARALGVETHVCEVQLLLVSMAAIKVKAPPPAPFPPLPPKQS